MTDQQIDRSITLLNVFTAVAGGLDELTAFQLSEMRALSAESAEHGWLGNEVYRSDDGTSLVVLTRFSSVEAKESWAGTERFARHVADLEPYVTEITSTPVTFVAAHGVPRR